VSEPPPPSVRVTPDGPYLVSGVPVVWRIPASTEAGEPITWVTGPDLDAGDAYVLCRCGQSGRKPFCDGTHKRVGFDGTEVAAGRYADRAREYVGTGVVVHDDRSICTHAGFCGTAATNVWKMIGDTDRTDVRSQVIAMIERCPSGALTYAVEGHDGTVEGALAALVGVVPDGPLFVSGGVTVTGSDGADLETRNRVTLCRCGQSKNKPLCDGSHRDAGFTSGP
jgi:CDGSH-type Zn-finger protein